MTFYDIIIGFLVVLVSALIVGSQIRTPRPTLRASFDERTRLWRVQKKLIAEIWLPYRLIQSGNFETSQKAEEWIIQHLAQLLHEDRKIHGNAFTHSHPAVRSRAKRLAASEADGASSSLTKTPSSTGTPSIPSDVSR